MIAEYIVYGMAVAGLMGFAYWQGYGEAQRRSKAKAPYGIESCVLRDIDSVPAGSMLIITYPGRLTLEQRAAIEGSVRVKVGNKIKVMILDGGLKATMVQNPVSMPSPGRKGSSA